MPTIIEPAKVLFEACEAWNSWSVCREYCAPDAAFAAQAEPLADPTTLQQHTDWMQGMMTVLAAATYEVKSFAIDARRNHLCAGAPGARWA